jgi:HlyD family secretion protein
MARPDPTRSNTYPVLAKKAGPDAQSGQRLPASLFFCFALIALVAGPGTRHHAADKPSGNGPTSPSRRQALERFRKMSPEERLQHVEKAANGGRAFVSVTRGDLKVTVVERGIIDAAEGSDIICRVKPKTASSKVATTIKNLYVEDGETVKKGQLLIELDSAALRDQLRLQKIALEKAAADRVTAEENLKIVQKQNQLDVRGAEIKLKLARLELKRFTGKDTDEKEILELKAEQAQVTLEGVKLQSKAKAGTAETRLKMKTVIEDQEAQQKRDLEAQLDRCVIKAPVDGVIIYHVPESARWGSSSPLVAPGEPVSEGQKLMRVSGLKRFAITCRIHEALVARVRAGQTAAVRVNAFPKRVLRGRVRSVATVDSKQDFLAADVKVYQTVLDITELLPGLKPGMSADVEIEVARRPKVLQVWVESILREGREPFCYVKVGKELQERKVKLGESNDFFVEIKEGLKELERVLWNPRAVARQLAPPREKNAKETAAPAPAKILVRSVRPPSGSSDGRRTRIVRFGLTHQDLKRISTLPDVSEVVPVRSFRTEARHRVRLNIGHAVATVPGYLELAGVRLETGRFLESEDASHSRNVAVLGAGAAERLFPLQDPVGQVVRLGRVCDSFVVVGVLRKQDRPAGGLMADQVNHGVYLPLRTCKAWFGEIIIDRHSVAFTAEAVPLTEILIATESLKQARYVVDCVAALLEEAHSRKDWDVRGLPVRR